jgi:hypothetical protein
MTARCAGATNPVALGTGSVIPVAQKDAGSHPRRNAHIMPRRVRHAGASPVEEDCQRGR